MKALNALKKFKESESSYLGINTVVTKMNLDQLIPLCDFVRRYGLDGIIFMPMNRVQVGDEEKMGELLVAP